MENLLSLHFTLPEVNRISVLGLAHIGDGVYELLVRSYLCVKGDTTLKNLHSDTIDMVKAPAQARYAALLYDMLTPEEQDFYRRGKNAHTHAAPKSASPREYAMATGLETLFGALYLMGKTERLTELFSVITKEEIGHGV